MDVSELLRRLQDYGLDEGESTFYYHLCRLGPSRAATVAEAAGRKRTDAYRILDKLVEQGFAQKSLERPARYLPRPVEEALERAMATRQAQTTALQSQRTLLENSWPHPVSQAVPARAKFTVHQGSTQVVGLLLRTIASAKEEVLMATSRDGLSRLDVAALTGALSARAKAGVTVRVLAKHARGGDPPLPDLPGVRIRYGDLPTFYQALIVDDREICLFVASGKGISGAEETVLWINSSDVVLAQKALFDLAWSHAVSQADLQVPGLPRQVQILRGRWVRGARLRNMVLGATESIVIRASAAEAAGWRQQGIVDSLAKQAANGIRVVLRIPAGDHAVAIPGVLLEPPGEDVHNLVAVVDGVQTLLGLGFSAPGDTAGAEAEWCIWSTHGDLVAALGEAWAPGSQERKVVRPAPTHASS